MAQEVRSSALQALEVDALAGQQHLSEIGEEIRGMRQVIAGGVRNPLDNLLPGLIVPVAGAFARGLKKSDGDKA